MQQSILALVRPRLNLAQPFNQVSHLIEHALVSPNRQISIGLSDKLFGTKILNSNGFTSELYLVEYYVVQSKVAEKIKKILIDSQNYLELSKNEEEYLAMRAVLIEELKERKLSIMSIMEQFERVIYQENSPALAQSWFDPTSIEKCFAFTVCRLKSRLQGVRKFSNLGYSGTLKLAYRLQCQSQRYHCGRFVQR